MKGVLRKGGANNRADRTSWHLTEKQARDLINGCRAAMTLGMGMNRFVTISWQLSGLDPRQSVAATGDWIKCARDWLRDRGYRTAWVWTQESGPKLGAHCHILLHVPPELAPLFRSKPTQWAKQIIARGRGAYKAKTVLTRIVANGKACNGQTEAYEALVMGRLHYLLKSAPAAFEEPSGMIQWAYKPWGQECLVYGKRAGVWQHRSVRKIKVAR